MKYAGIIMCLFVIHVIAIAEIHYVPDNYNSIQGAVDVLSSGDTILVSDGEYIENITAYNGVTFSLASEFLLDGDSSHISNTIIRSLDDDEFHSPLRIQLSLQDTVFINGITLTGGRLNPEGSFSTAKCGGGLYVHGGMADIRNCIITDNIAKKGGGIFVYNANTIIENCIIYDNLISDEGGGIAAIQGEEAEDNIYSIILKRNKVFNNGEINTIYNCGGGGISVGGYRNINSIIEENTIENNCNLDRAGGIYIASNTILDSSSCIIRNNIIRYNSADSYAAVSIGSDIISLLVENNIIENNIATTYWGTGIAMRRRNNAYYEVKNNIISNNSGQIGGAILVMTDCHIHNNVFIGNQGRVVSGIMFWTGHSAGDTSKTVMVDHNIFVEQEYDASEPETYVGAVSPMVEGNYLHLHHNDFLNNQKYAAGLRENPDYWPPGVLFADSNYWGDPSGPYHPDENPTGLGDTVRANISILPFLTEPATAPHSIEVFFPEDGAEFTRQNVLFWWSHAVDPTTLEPVQYGVQLANDPDFTACEEYPAGEDTTLAISGLLGESYYWRVYAEDSFELRGYSQVGSFSLSVSEDEATELPATWSIQTPYPNPFNNLIRCVVTAPESNRVSLAVYDVLGRKVDMLFAGPVSAGLHPFTWRPSEVAAGVYFLRLSTDSGILTQRKIVYVK